MRIASGLLALTILTTLTVGGCPAPADPNDPNNSGLTTTERGAVEAVVTRLVASNAVLGTCAPLSDSRLNPDTIGQLGTFGTCPHVGFASSPVAAVLSFDFGTGCASAATGGKTVSGRVDVDIDRLTRTVAVTFASVTIDIHAITGTMNFTHANRTGGITLSGTCDLNTAGVGSIDGNVTVQVDATGVLTLTTGTLSLDSSSPVDQITLNNLVVDPLANGNFVPESGTLSFTLANTGAGPATILVTVTFTNQSPVDGTVRVTIGSAAAVNYKVPGIS